MAPFRLKIWRMPLFTSFLFNTWIFSRFLCIVDVAYLNCHPFLPVFNHIYPFSIPLFSPLWGTREGRGGVAILICPHHGDPEKERGDVAILIYPHHGDPEKARVM